MRITVPENVQLFGKGASCYDAFRYMQSWLVIATKDFNIKYPHGQAYDIVNMEANYICDIIKNLSSMYLICTSNKDYRSGAILCRAIADRVAVLKLVYANPIESERLYRYYLYLLDGMRERAKMLNDPMEYNGKISKDEYDVLTEQIAYARISTEKCIEFCQNNLNYHEYATQFPDFHKSAVKEAAWQFKALGILGKKNKVLKYKWEELYALIDNRPVVISMYSKYLSQFVHGLSIGVLPNQDCEDNIDSLMSIGVCLQGVIMNELKNQFNIKETIFKNITQEEIAIILSFYSDDHRQELFDKFSPML